MCQHLKFEIRTWGISGPSIIQWTSLTCKYIKRVDYEKCNHMVFRGRVGLGRRANPVPSGWINMQSARLTLL